MPVPFVPGHPGGQDAVGGDLLVELAGAHEHAGGGLVASPVPFAVDAVEGELGSAVVGGLVEGQAGGHELARFHGGPVDAAVDA